MKTPLLVEPKPQRTGRWIVGGIFLLACALLVWGARNRQLAEVDVAEPSSANQSWQDEEELGGLGGWVRDNMMVPLASYANKEKHKTMGILVADLQPKELINAVITHVALILYVSEPVSREKPNGVTSHTWIFFKAQAQDGETVYISNDLTHLSYRWTPITQLNAGTQHFEDRNGAVPTPDDIEELVATKVPTYIDWWEKTMVGGGWYPAKRNDVTLKMVLDRMRKMVTDNRMYRKVDWNCYDYARETAMVFFGEDYGKIISNGDENQIWKAKDAENKMIPNMRVTQGVGTAQMVAMVIAKWYDDHKPTDGVGGCNAQCCPNDPRFNKNDLQDTLIQVEDVDIDGDGDRSTRNTCPLQDVVVQQLPQIREDSPITVLNPVDQQRQSGQNSGQVVVMGPKLNGPNPQLKPLRGDMGSITNEVMSRGDGEVH